MPYEIIENHPDCSGYAVVKQGTMDMQGCHETREDAQAQLEALYAREPDASQGIRPMAAGISFETGFGGALAFGQFTALATGLTEVRETELDSTVSWDEAVAALADLGTVHVNMVCARESSAVVTVESPKGRAVALVNAYPSWDEWRITVAAASGRVASAVLNALVCIVPPREQVSEQSVDVHFWMHHPMAGAVSRRRGLDRLPWSDVQGNYPGSIRSKLDELSSLTSAPTKGRLLVFHGPAGTGKTRYIQSLADSWQKWCNVDYIVDPDEMLRSALYLNTVLLEGESEPDRWRLVVIEDGDEFIDRQAKARTGHAIARLLNVADGMIGQGLKVMVLVSTNVAQARFAEAVVRTGRCGALVEFPPFTADEAGAWCTERGLEPPGKAATLAELYDMLA